LAELQAPAEPSTGAVSVYQGLLLESVDQGVAARISCQAAILVNFCCWCPLIRELLLVSVDQGLLVTCPAWQLVTRLKWLCCSLAWYKRDSLIWVSRILPGYGVGGTHEAPSLPAW